MIVVSGANGAGKSTLAPHLLRDTFGILEYVNADTIALGLSAFAPERAALAAGRVMLKRMNELAAQKVDFAFETTLATRFYAKWLRNLQGEGYRISLIFLWLQSAELAVERVEARVRLGGHNVHAEIIRRRYVRGLRNFLTIYQLLVHEWTVYDVSHQFPIEIAFGGRKDNLTIVEENSWKMIQAAAR